MCVYRDSEGAPSCLVGHVLAELTPDVRLVDGTVRANYRILREWGYSPRALYALQMAQAMQDSEETWGVALKAAQFAYHNWDMGPGDA
jgi:hypothetical protein